MAHCRQELPTGITKPFTYSPPTKCLSAAVNRTQSCIVLSLDIETKLMFGPLQVRPSVWNVSIDIAYAIKIPKPSHSYIYIYILYIYIYMCVCVLYTMLYIIYIYI